MRVNIVTEPHGWILHRCAQELATRLPDVTVNGSGADVSYCLPAYFRQISGRRVGLFTHPTDAQIQEFAPKCVAHVAMNRRVADRLRAAGVDPVVIRPGTDTPQRSIRFGVCGRTYPHTKRKGEAFVADMVKAGFQVRAWGRGWPCEIVSDRVDYLPSFYRQIDYLVVTSLEEGGPMPVVDAIAHGVPVIAPDVGWCWEFPVIRYVRGQWDSLKAVLMQLTTPPTWESWAEGHRHLFARLAVTA